MTEWCRVIEFVGEPTGFASFRPGLVTVHLDNGGHIQFPLQIPAAIIKMLQIHYQLVEELDYKNEFLTMSLENFQHPQLVSLTVVVLSIKGRELEPFWQFRLPYEAFIHLLNDYPQ